MNLNITKKQWMIIGVVVAIVAVWYFFLRKKKVESGYTAFQLDPRGVESSFDPALPLIGGNENGYTANQLDPNGIESGFSFGRSFRATPRFTPVASPGRSFRATPRFTPVASPLGPLGKTKPTRAAIGTSGQEMQWCCAEYDTYGVCARWEKRATDAPCGGLNS